MDTKDSKKKVFPLEISRSLFLKIFLPLFPHRLDFWQQEKSEREASNEFTFLYVMLTTKLKPPWN